MLVLFIMSKIAIIIIKMNCNFLPFYFISCNIFPATFSRYFFPVAFCPTFVNDTTQLAQHRAQCVISLDVVQPSVRVYPGDANVVYTIRYTYLHV